MSQRKKLASTHDGPLPASPNHQFYKDFESPAAFINHVYKVTQERTDCPNLELIFTDVSTALAHETMNYLDENAESSCGR
ncbi:hypothetical protein BDV06DRAFT_223617 [Aspergillus oleicola]